MIGLGNYAGLGALNCACQNKNSGMGDFVARGLAGSGPWGDPVGVGAWVSQGNGTAVNTSNGVTGMFPPGMAFPAGAQVPNELVSVPGSGGGGAGASAGVDAGGIFSTILGVPGQITGAFGMTPAQATMFGLQLAGKAPKQAPPPPPPSSGISGTTVLVGVGVLAALGIAFGLSSRSSAPAAASHGKK